MYRIQLQVNGGSVFSILWFKKKWRWNKKCFGESHTQNLTGVVVNVCSPRDDVRAEAHHERADERADLLGGPQPPPLLLIQAFLSHAAKAQRYHYRPRRHDQRQADIMQPSTEETCGNDAGMEAVNCAAVIAVDYRGEISHCTDINYANGEAIQSLIIWLDRNGEQMTETQNTRKSSSTFRRHDTVTCQQASAIIRQTL